MQINKSIDNEQFETGKEYKKGSWHTFNYKTNSASTTPTNHSSNLQ